MGNDTAMVALTKTKRDGEEEEQLRRAKRESEDEELLTRTSWADARLALNLIKKVSKIACCSRARLIGNLWLLDKPRLIAKISRKQTS